jgi:hypothetical protein
VIDRSGATAPLRSLILALFAIGAAGTSAELLLIGHFEDGWQLAPVVLLAAGVVAAGWISVSRARASIRAFQLVTLLLIGTGAIGLWFHWRANSEFEREVSPSLTGMAFVWKAMRGASPPSAAPGTLIHLGLLGLAYTFRHPAFDRGDTR